MQYVYVHATHIMMFCLLSFISLRNIGGGYKCPIYLNTESYDYDDPELDIRPVHYSIESTWSKRLIHCLKHIKERNVLIVLDDFFIISPVDVEGINKCLKWLNENRKIACFNFRAMNIKHETESVIWPGFRERDPRNSFWVNYLPALWNRKALLSILSPYEDPWQSELYGTERAKRSGYLFLEMIKTNDRIIDVNMSPSAGYGLVHGKWTPNTKDLFEKHNFECDFSKRGFSELNYDYSTEVTSPPKIMLRDKMNYLFHGGLPYGCYYNEKIYLTFSDHIKVLINDPKFFCRITMNKIRFFMSRNYGEV